MTPTDDQLGTVMQADAHYLRGVARFVSEQGRPGVALRLRKIADWIEQDNAALRDARAETGTWRRTAEAPQRGCDNVNRAAREARDERDAARRELADLRAEIEGKP